jgi:hypothetical protein
MVIHSVSEGAGPCWEPNAFICLGTVAATLTFLARVATRKSPSSGLDVFIGVPRFLGGGSTLYIPQKVGQLHGLPLKRVVSVVSHSLSEGRIDAFRSRRAVSCHMLVSG